MTVMTRILSIIDGHEVSAMPITIDYPVEISKREFRCDFKIDWPAGAYVGKAFGIDAIQALELTFNIIAVRLYLSDLHKYKRLYWEKIGDGYGLSLSEGSRHLAERSDRRLR